MMEIAQSSKQGGIEIRRHLCFAGHPGEQLAIRHLDQPLELIKFVFAQLLDHAYATVPFYRDRLSNTDYRPAQGITDGIAPCPALSDRWNGASRYRDVGRAADGLADAHATGLSLRLSIGCRGACAILPALGPAPPEARGHPHIRRGRGSGFARALPRRMGHRDC